ncbi:hypothetical protein [Pedobacter sp. SYSU D00535]|uniref:hypothetical protein n=1 Tax=Pedobacter sp. SYSU D00535 TaxID=2810308 RepID=UPI001A97B401|nr:hypothetical protein [Pedobacter sp. SYSU D00535]
MKDKFLIKKGLKVWEAGSVVIDSVRHIVKDGFIKCNASLNHSAWNTTIEKKKCRFCFARMYYEQASLFEGGVA